MTTPDRRTAATYSSRANEFAELVTNGLLPEDAAVKLGFPKRDAARFLLQPATKMALASITSGRMQTILVPKAMAVIEAILDDPKVSPAVRAKLALGVLDRARKDAPEDNANPLKNLNELSHDGLVAVINRLAIAAREQGELIDVTPHDDAPAEARIDILEEMGIE